MNIGDIVEVADEGLLRLQQFAPKDAIPNNQGVISGIGVFTYDIIFPIGRDNPKEHSQMAPYKKELIHIKDDYHPFMEKVKEAVLEGYD